jgi:hypothetical protein
MRVRKRIVSAALMLSILAVGGRLWAASGSPVPPEAIFSGKFTASLTINYTDVEKVTGTASALGVLTLDGKGGVTGSFGAVSPEDQASGQATCSVTIAPSTYTVNSNVTAGTFSLVFPGAGSTNGTLNFNLSIYRSALFALTANMVGTNQNPSGLVICSKAISSAAYTGLLTETR